MSNNLIENTVKKLREFFIEELGWDTYSKEFMLSLENKQEEKIFSLAEKRGFCVYLSTLDKRSRQFEVHRRLRDITYEHITIFAKKNYWTWQYQEKPYLTYYRKIVPFGFVPSIKFSLENEKNTHITNVCKEVNSIFKIDDYEKSFHLSVKTGEQKWVQILYFMRMYPKKIEKGQKKHLKKKGKQQKKNYRMKAYQHNQILKNMLS